MKILEFVGDENNKNVFNSDITISTKRKLESLGLDPYLIHTENQALKLISERISDKLLRNRNVFL